MGVRTSTLAAASIAAAALPAFIGVGLGFALAVMDTSGDAAATLLVAAIAASSASALGGTVLGIAAIVSAGEKEASSTTGIVGLVLSLLSLAAALGSGALIFIVIAAGSGHGRPLRVGGAVVPTPTRLRPRRTRGGRVTPRVQVAGLGWSQRVRLGASWLADARLEHAAVHAFRQLARDLRAVGAPASLVSGARRAAREEARHTRRCFDVASTYLGFGVGPGPVKVPPRRAVTHAELLGRLLEESLTDGCIGEAAASELAGMAAQSTHDPAIRAALREIERDEATHAEHAWDVTLWARAVLGHGASFHEARALERAQATREVAAPFDDLARHGRATSAQQATTRSRVIASTRARLRRVASRAPRFST